MNEPLSAFVKQQYAAFRGKLKKSWSVDETNRHLVDSRLKPIHKKFLSLACAASAVGRRSKSRCYISGVTEAAYLSQCLAAKGIANPTAVLLRQSIELVLKFIYFSFHPIELHWASTRENYKDITFQYLLDFMKRTDEHKSFVKYCDISTSLDEIYGVLSRYVHVQSGPFIKYSPVPLKEEELIKVMRNFANHTERLWPLFNILIVLYFPERYHSAHDNERRLIMSSIPKDLKKRLHYYCSNHPKSRYR